MNAFAPYQAATGCTKYGPQGAQAFTTYTEDVFAELHRLMGICNCRSIVGGSSWSHHAECRAADDGFTIRIGERYGYEYALIIAEKADRIGVDHIITNARPWDPGRGQPIVFSARSPNGRTYTGTHPHKDHNHTGFTRSAGRNLTYATLVHVYGPPEAVARRLRLTTGQGEDDMLDFDIGRGDEASVTGPRAEALQRMLLDRGEKLPEWGPDGAAGPETRNALASFQRKNSITGEGGVVGPRTYAALYKPSGGGVSSGTVDDKIRAHAANPDAHHE